MQIRPIGVSTDVAMSTFATKVENLITAGLNVTNGQDYGAWSSRVDAFLASAIDAEAATAFRALGNHFAWNENRDRQIGHLEGLALRVEAAGLSLASAHPAPEATPALTVARSSRVFLVHGHDVGTTETVARFLEKLTLKPIVLHEQTNEGRTIIEKFESFADVGFAVVLLTPDDVGAAASAKEHLTSRARQNVILELGYFTGKLGRSRVCALYKTGVEIPSDLHGVAFVELDAAGAWRMKLAQELVRAGMKIELQGLLPS
jgi:predicted nucleotide-binding protein